MTVTQLGGPVGALTLGRLFLNRIDEPGARASGHALPVCSSAPADAVIPDGATGLVLRRR
ncbi:hypothetical protein AB0M87_04895 [Streptomyces sp. NPDC051320]|uniref:hypothetical protein n=1 Tax=Streptomyces sp. NPDC051320 TaxID=3154644 RepID=UPI00341370C8